MSIVSPLGTVLETPCSSIMKLAAASTIGLSTFQTVSATMLGTLDVGMDAVALVQRRVARDLVEQERQQRDLVLSARSRYTCLNDTVYSGPKFGGASMPGEQHGDALLLRALDDRRRGSSSSRRSAGRAARRSRPSSRTRMRTSPWLKRPVDPLQPGGRRVARDPGVDDVPLVAVGVQLSLEQRRIRLCFEQAQPGGQTVAKHDDLGVTRIVRIDRRGAGAGPARAVGPAAAGCGCRRPAASSARPQLRAPVDRENGICLLL